MTAVLYRGQCAIPLDTTLLLTGGWYYNSVDYVTEYSEDGLVREWPRLREARDRLSCGRVGQVSAMLYSDC